MSATTSVVETKEPKRGPVKEQPPVKAPESDFKIEHSYEILDEDLLQDLTPSVVQSVKLAEFKAKLSNLECLILRARNDEAQVVAREIAQRVYLDDDKQTIVLEPSTVSQIQMHSLLNTAAPEVQETI